MTAGTTRTRLVAVEDEYLQAVWMIMQGDDDLAHDLIHRGIFYAVNRVLGDMPHTCWPLEDYLHLRRFLYEERVHLEDSTNEMAERFLTYSKHKE